MAKLTELKSKDHQDLKLSEDAMIKHAASQHVCNLQAHEVANAATCFPVFMTRSSTAGQIVLSAMMSFTVKENLFVQDKTWQSVFQPTSFRTYPLFLMQSPENEKQCTIGFDESSSDLSNETGLPLFTSEGKASPLLSEKTQLLEAELGHMRQTYEFTEALNKLDLLKAVDLQVHYQSGEVAVIKGLITVDEDKIQSIDNQALDELRKKGYLAPMYAMLISLFQVNVLITKHNQLTSHNKIKTVKIEVSKDTTAS
ncbi:SapC family protein [Agaribacter flavus]|uniref:SapC family protein n=1 Tax=Agaribacter flavus TaxID=1902781 RepID=A0ABV7FQC0_9ALTE